MKYPSRVDHHRLSGHGFGAAHRDHHVGAAVLVAGFFRSDEEAERSTCSTRRLTAALVPSSRPGGTQLTSVSGANAAAMQPVR
jgi:hypothetical protein